jgi:hypothetical protein
MDITTAIKSLRPSASFSVIGEDIDKIEWINCPNKPTNEEILVEKERLLKEYLALEYQRQRKTEYPPLADLADAIYWQAQGDDSKMTAYVAACEAVKLKYPKGV